MMADDRDVTFVTDNIEPNYSEHGWSDQEILDRLDTGSVPQRVVAAYWRMRASQTILLVNTSESGSSRGNDAIYSRMRDLADAWDQRALAVENVITPVQTSARISSFPIKRV
jgi:hypothetical protein